MDGNNKPLFLVFEGIDGSGKTTIIHHLSENLKLLNFDVVSLKEPTGGPNGKEIRSLLSQKDNPSPEKLLNLFIEDRKEDMTNNILPALKSNKIILMDRYYYSNAAYQGTENLTATLILEKNLTQGFPPADRVYYIDIDPETALKRISSRSEIEDIQTECFEDLKFLEQVKFNYEQIRDEKFLTIDGNISTEDQLLIIVNDIKELLDK